MFPFLPDFHVCDFNNTELLLRVFGFSLDPSVQYYSNNIISNKISSYGHMMELIL